MKDIQVIFCGANYLYWQGIELRVSSFYNTSFVRVASIKDAVKAVPKKGKCIVVTESVLLEEEYAFQLPSLCKAKNPDSVVVLYTGQTYGMESSFDYYIDRYDRDSYEELSLMFLKHCS